MELVRAGQTRSMQGGSNGIGSDTGQLSPRALAAIERIAAKYDVPAQPLADSIMNLREANALRPPDSAEIEAALAAVVSALFGPASASTPSPASQQQEWQPPAAFQPASSQASAESGLVNNQQDGNDQNGLDELRSDLVALGIPPQQMEAVLEHLQQKLRDQKQAEQDAGDAQLSMYGAQSMAVNNPYQNFNMNTADTSGANSDSSGAIGETRPKMNANGGTNLWADPPFIFEGKYADGNIRSNFTKDNVDAANSTVNYNNGQGGSLVSQNYVHGGGTLAVDFSGQVSENVKGGGVFAFVPGKAELDLNEQNLGGDPMMWKVTVHNHENGTRPYEQDVDMRKLGYTDPSQFKDLRIESKFVDGSFEVSYQNAQGKMQQVASYKDDGNLYRQMNSSDKGYNWQTNIWSGQEGAQGSVYQKADNLSFQPA